MRAEVREPTRRRGAIALALCAGSLFALGQAGLWLSIEPIATWSYDFSWWSAILLADAWVHLRAGRSILLSRPRGFLGLSIASGAYWLLFECANLRLKNWYYVGIPPDPWTRSLGVYFAFATVLPGVLEIHSFLSCFAARRKEPVRASPLPASTHATLHALGLACLLLPLLFPRTAYPLIWGAAFLLLEPWLASRDERSLLARLRAGDAGPILRLLAAGAVCGLLWETWNWRSPAKWIYTVPLFEDGKLFEMPYLGFVGFVPFALGCHSFARFLVRAGLIPEWDPAATGIERFEARRALAAGVPALLFSVAAIAGVNRFTIHATRPRLADLPGLPEALAGRLESAGIRHLEDLLAAPEAVWGGAEPGERRRWLEAARLMNVRGLGRRGLEWLAGAGVRTAAELAARDPAELHRAILSAARGPAPVPSKAEVRVWVLGARGATAEDRT